MSKYLGRYTVRRAPNELEILTRDPIYRKRAEEVAERVRAEESVHAASDAIGSLLTTTSHRHGSPSLLTGVSS